MKRNKTNRHTIRTLIALTCLSLLVGNTSFAEEQTRSEYIREVIELNEIEVLESPTNDVDSYVYTALQLGLVKGISFDFGGVISDGEKVRINENVYESEKWTPVTIAFDEELAEPNQASGSIYDTEWGRIKVPTKLGESVEIWTDEEFHEFLSDIQTVLPYWGNYSLSTYADGTPTQQTIYYDENSKKIRIKVRKEELVDGKYVTRYVYDAYDQVEYERIYNAFKTVLYFTVKENLDLEITNHGDAILFNIKSEMAEKLNDRSNIKLYVPFARWDGMINCFLGDDGRVDVDDFDIAHVWDIIELFDSSIYSEYGLSKELTHDEFDEMKNIRIISKYTQQYYADLLYELCQSLYGSSSEEIYGEIMRNYIREWTQSVEYGDKSTFSSVEQFDMYRVYSVHDEYSSLWLAVTKVGE